MTFHQNKNLQEIHKFVVCRLPSALLDQTTVHSSSTTLNLINTRCGIKSPLQSILEEVILWAVDGGNYHGISLWYNGNFPSSVPYIKDSGVASTGSVLLDFCHMKLITSLFFWTGLFLVQVTSNSPKMAMYYSMRW